MSKARVDLSTGLTTKEKLFADLFLYYFPKVKNPAQRAAAIAYKDTDAVRRVYAYRVLYKERVRNYLGNKFDEAGLTPEVIVGYLRIIVDRGLKGKAITKDALKVMEMTFRLRGWL